MGQLEDRYISLLTDFGFKRIFGTGPNKELLVNFLNSLFDGEQVIKDVRYLNSEHIGDNKDELREYEDSLKAYRDIKNSIDTALEEGMERGLEQGRAEGRIEGRMEIVRAMLAKGMDIDMISELTGVSADEIHTLQ